MTRAAEREGMRWAPLSAFAAGVLILAAATWGIIDQSKATGAHAALIAALALGTAVGAVVVARGSFGVRVFVIFAVLAGEGYGMLATSERILAVREGQQFPARDAEVKKREARQAIEALRKDVAPISSARLEQALAAKRATDAALVAKAAERACAENCRQLLQGAVTEAAEELARARKQIEAGQAAWRQRLEGAEDAYSKIVVPGSGSPLADRLGMAPWALDLIAAALLTFGSNALAAVLIAWGVHTGSQRTEPDAAVTVPISMTEVVAEVAPVAVPVTPKASTEATVTTVAEVATRAPKAAEQGTTLAMQAGDFVEFCFDSLELVDGIVEQTAIEQGYQAWCRRRKVMPLPAEKVREGIVAFCKASQGRVERGQRDGVLYVVGVELRKPKRGLRAVS